MQRSTEITLSGTWTLLKTLVDAALEANSEAPWMDMSFNINLRSPSTNAAGTKVQVTSDFVDKAVAYEILVEADRDFSGGGATHNSVTMLDKLVRIVDGAGAGTTGTAVVSSEWS